MATSYYLETRNGGKTEVFPTIDALIPAAKAAAEGRVPYRIYTDNAEGDCDEGVWTWYLGLSAEDNEALEDAGLDACG